MTGRAVSASVASMADDVLTTLFPQPRTVRRLEGDPVPATTAPDIVQTPDVPAQGYLISVRDGGIRIEHADEAGMRYALETLAQLARDGEVAPVEIEDAPAFTARGFMLDISRDRVPTRATLTWLLDVLAGARYNQLQLYTEHTFAYRDWEHVWRDASPMTPDDIAWLQDECQSRGIELVPNQNVFGHMERWFRADPELRKRAEVPDGFEMWGGHHDATTLVPNAENAALAHTLLDELLANFASRTVNIGCDETWELGKGASAERAEREGVGRVYLDHVKAIAEPLLQRGYTVQFWGDIVNDHPELASQIPDGMVPVVWWYERPYPDPAASPWGTAPFEDGTFGDASNVADLKRGVESQLAGFIELGREYWVAPGTGTWQSLVGRTSNAYANLRQCAGLASDLCRGWLLTNWGDNGHWEHPVVSLPPIVFGGAVAWNPSVDPEALVPAAVSAALGDETGRLADALELAGAQWDQLGVPISNASPLFRALQAADVSDWPVLPNAEQVAVRSALQEARSLASTAQPAGQEGALRRDELIVGLDVALWNLDRLDPELRDEPVDGPALEDLLRRQARACPAPARPGGPADPPAQVGSAGAAGVDPRAIAADEIAAAEGR